VSGYPRPRTVAAVPLRDLPALAAASVRDSSGRDVSLADLDQVVTGITHDSSAVRPGDLYLALPGSRRHGAEFAAAAVAAGAAAVLTDAAGAGVAIDRARAELVATPAVPGTLGVPMLVVDEPRAVLGEVSSAIYGYPTARLPVIGITGTAGKTSTAYLIESALRAAGHVTCMIGTVETRFADVVVDSVRTTPEAPDVHALFAAALERGASVAVMEVSSHALAYERVGGVQFAVGGFTNFGLDHLDFHADVDDYFAAKAKLFDGRCRAEVLNLDDPAVRRLVPRCESEAPGAEESDCGLPRCVSEAPGAEESGCGRRRLTFSASGDPAATWRAADVTRVGFTQRFTALGPDGQQVKAGVALPGRHNVANALLALACLVEVGLDPETAAQGVAACRGVPGRLELVDAPGPVLGVVDYAHKPDAIVAALAALREVGTGRVIAVIGAGGDRDRGKRPYMGEAAARGSDLVVITDDNPRHEDPAAIRAEVRLGAQAAGARHLVEIAGRREAIAEAVRLAEPGDVVAVLGKGHERDQDVAGVMSSFDDRVELAAALAGRFGGEISGEVPA
jgi:UDP-N-acetylmuramoyl-L-alanyl-D-glutamate--2,6-diaminopimelate ligase